MPQKDLLDVYNQLSLSFSPIEKLFQTMSAIDTDDYRFLITKYGEFGERLAEQFKKDLHQLLLETGTGHKKSLFYLESGWLP